VPFHAPRLVRQWRAVPGDRRTGPVVELSWVARSSGARYIDNRGCRVAAVS
jgi:hypothetical protein